jgi:excinuclease ABC subunit C
MHFGTSRAVRGATLEDLENAPGISKAMAKAIHDHFRAP